MSAVVWVLVVCLYVATAQQAGAVSAGYAGGYDESVPKVRETLKTQSKDR